MCGKGGLGDDGRLGLLLKRHLHNKWVPLRLYIYLPGLGRGADGNFEMALLSEGGHMMDFAVRRRGSFFHAT